MNADIRGKLGNVKIFVYNRGKKVKEQLKKKIRKYEDKGLFRFDSVLGEMVK